MGNTLFVVVGEGCTGKSSVVAGVMRRLRRHVHIVRKETTRPQHTDPDRANLDALFYDFVKPERMLSHRAEYVSFAERSIGLFGLRRSVLDGVLERGHGLLVHHPSGIEELRAAGYPVCVVHLVATHRPPECDTRSEARRAFDAREFATPPDADLVLNNSFLPDGLQESVDVLADFIMRR